MKTKNPFKTGRLILLAGFFFISSLGFGAEKTKTISKNYNVTSQTEIMIDNMFGQVDFRSWSKNEVSVEIKITAEGRSEEDADEILDEIEILIDDSNPKSMLGFKTKIRDRWSNGRRKFAINYLVSAPIGNAIDLRVRHGEILLDNRDGEVRIDIQHGGMDAKNLNGECRIEMAHGGGSIDLIKSGDLEIRHIGRLIIGEMGDVDIDMQHSNIRMENGGNLFAHRQAGPFPRVLPPVRRVVHQLR
jgi:hypothetical protein